MPYARCGQDFQDDPHRIGHHYQKALQMNPDLKKAYENEEDTHHLIDMSMRLEGLPRHSSTHAAGVVICREPVMEYGAPQC